MLFADGLGARIKEQLLRECNLHTVVRLPDGVFAPYTDIPTNLLFFERTGRTREVWFYELPLPDGRRKYTKTKPLRFEEFDDCRDWWGGRDRAGREETKFAWRVPIAEITDDGYNLDRHHPDPPNDLAHRPPAELLAELLDIERGILADLESLQSELERNG